MQCCSVILRLVRQTQAETPVTSTIRPLLRLIQMPVRSRFLGAFAHTLLDALVVPSYYAVLVI